jgi:3-oxoacyl-[acyl-carrier-protein] synthase III
MYSRIIDIDYYLPKKFSVKKIFEKNNWNFDNTFQKTGIKFIRRSDQNTTALDLALKASSKIAKKNRKKIDTIIYITQSPEYNLPSRFMHNPK